MESTSKESAQSQLDKLFSEITEIESDLTTTEGLAELVKADFDDELTSVNENREEKLSCDDVAYVVFHARRVKKELASALERLISIRETMDDLIEMGNERLEA